MKQRKKLEDLNVLDDFMLNAIANDSTVAEPFFREVLSTLLERQIGEITVHAQSFLPGDTPELRGVCLDVEIHESDNSPASCSIYNVEAQNYRESYFQKRCRFYQAKKDSKGLMRGEDDWSKLPDLYMIIITNYDPFEAGKLIYSFENVCREAPEIMYNDGLKFIYFNAAAPKNDVKSNIHQLLSYLNNSKIENVTNRSIAQLHSYVNDVKKTAEVRQRYMTIGNWLDRERAEERAEGREEGRAEGREEGRKEGREEATRNTLSNILSSKFSTIPEVISGKLQSATSEDLNKWIILAATSNSLDEFLAKLD